MSLSPPVTPNVDMSKFNAFVDLQNFEHDIEIDILKDTDVNRAIAKLACGHTSESPFTEEQVSEARTRIAELIKVRSGKIVSTAPEEEQCFLLGMMAELARMAGDPDWRVLCEGDKCFLKGVVIGYKEPLPRTPAVYSRKVKWHRYDDELLSQHACMLFLRM